jgi:hypothetical protein
MNTSKPRNSTRSIRPLTFTTVVFWQPSTYPFPRKDLHWNTHIIQIIYKILLPFTKSSILFLYLRIWSPPTPFFRASIYTTLAIILSWSVGSIISTIFQCHPIAGFWDASIHGVKCYNTDAFWYAYGIINIITDFIVLVLPLPEIKRLHLPTPQRWGVAGIFCLGILYV